MQEPLFFLPSPASIRHASSLSALCAVAIAHGASSRIFAITRNSAEDARVRSSADPSSISVFGVCNERRS